MEDKIFFILIAGIFMVWGIYLIVNFYKDKKRKYDIIKGKVIDIYKDSDNESGTQFYPIIEYEYKNNIYKTKSRCSDWKLEGFKKVPGDKYLIGSLVDLRVYAGKEPKAVINNEAEINVPLYGRIIATIVGAALIIGIIISIII